MPIINKKLTSKEISNIINSNIVQYYIVRSDIGMSVGKMCSQVAHGAQIFSMYLWKNNIDNLTNKWLNSGYAKIILKGKEKDFNKIKEELSVFVVIDAGLTDNITPGTETVLVTYPILKESSPKILKRLRLLNKE